MPVVLLTGSLAIALLYLIPVVGFVVVLLPVVVGTGVAVVSGLGSRPDWLWSRFRTGGAREAASSG